MKTAINNWTVRNFAAKILPNDWGEVSNCFQVLFLNSSCGIRVQTRITYIGRMVIQQECHHRHQGSPEYT